MRSHAPKRPRSQPAPRRNRCAEAVMFRKILHANDGSEGAFRALSVALEIARQSKAELHSVSVEEISQFPETIGEVKAEKGAADRRFRNVTKRAHKLAAGWKVELRTHVLTGHPVV